MWNFTVATVNYILVFSVCFISPSNPCQYFLQFSFFKKKAQGKGDREREGERALYTMAYVWKSECNLQEYNLFLPRVLGTELNCHACQQMPLPIEPFHWLQFFLMLNFSQVIENHSVVFICISLLAKSIEFFSLFVICTKTFEKYLISIYIFIDQCIFVCVFSLCLYSSVCS